MTISLVNETPYQIVHHLTVGITAGFRVLQRVEKERRSRTNEVGC